MSNHMKQATATKIIRELEEAIKAVAAKHNLEFDNLKKIQLSTEGGLIIKECKLYVPVVEDEEDSVQSLVNSLYEGKVSSSYKLSSDAKANFEHHCDYWGVEANLFGKIFKTTNDKQTFQVIEWNNRNRKSKIIAVDITDHNKKYKFTHADFKDERLIKTNSYVKFI